MPQNGTIRRGEGWCGEGRGREDEATRRPPGDFKLYTLTYSVDTSQSLLEGQGPMALERPLMYLCRMTLAMIFTLQDQPAIGRDQTDDWFLLCGGLRVRPRRP
jgi:hypothetical protein